MNVRNNKDVEFSVSNEHINDEVKKKIASNIFFLYFVLRNKVCICTLANLQCIKNNFEIVSAIFIMEIRKFKGFLWTVQSPVNIRPSTVAV